MDGLIEPSPLSDKRDWRPVYLGVGLVVIVMPALLFFSCAHSQDCRALPILTPPI